MFRILKFHPVYTTFPQNTGNKLSWNILKNSARWNIHYTRFQSSVHFPPPPLPLPPFLPSSQRSIRLRICIRIYREPWMKITETSSNRPKRLKTSITELDAFISIATGPRFFFFKSLARNFQLVLFTRREETTSASRWVELEKFFALIAPLSVIISDMRCSRWNRWIF